MNLASELTERIERASVLDHFSGPLVAVVAKAVRPRAVRNCLSGTPLGHPAHPMLTDVPIGAWASAAFLDIFGGRSSRRAADLLVKLGVLSALPTAASGLNDWSDTYGPETRLGMVHAAANSGALVVYCLSARARKRGRRARGKLLGLVGFGMLVGGSYLGGHLSFSRGTNVNRLAYEAGPDDWTPVLADAELSEGEHRRVDAAGTGVLLSRDAGRVWAISATCSHMGGPLEEGEFADGCVTCPWHGSIFRLSDGGIERGPACVRQHVFQTRISDGQIEVCAAS
ncbi:MAG: Rieske 2Fe-2S domain-containing protein [Solirubrobacteraceae bacterium]